MKNFLVLFSLLLQLPLWGTNVILPQTSNTNESLNDIFFIDSYSGWAVGESGSIRHTSDGGVHWVSQNSSVTTALNDIVFFNNRIGWCVGANGIILGTVDGGETWKKFNSGLTNILQSVACPNDSTIYIVGNSDVILKSVDRGLSWVSKSSKKYPEAQSVTFISNTVGWIAGKDIILKTITGGDTWSTLYPKTGKPLYDICFASADSGWCVGGDAGGGVILLTIDGGLTWDSKAFPETDALLSVSFIDTNEGWAVGSGGVILHTTNGGTTWSVVPSNTTENLKSVSFKTSVVGWISGTMGVVLHQSRQLEISLVTVGEESRKNVIAWQRYYDSNIESYKIYKLYGSDYKPLETVQASETSVYIDYESQPSVKSERYKIASIDAFGNESIMSPYHETVNLSYSLGGDKTTNVLNWNLYADESKQFKPEWNYIYRGTQRNNLTLYDSVSGAISSFNDENIFEQYFYQIMIKLPRLIEPDKLKSDSGPFSQSLSNLSEAIILSEDKLMTMCNIEISPNPTTDYVQIQMPQDCQDTISSIQLIAEDGTVVMVQNKLEPTLDVRNLNKGLYLLRIKMTSEVLNKTIVIE